MCVQPDTPLHRYPRRYRALKYLFEPTIGFLESASRSRLFVSNVMKAMMGRHITISAALPTTVADHIVAPRICWLSPYHPPFRQLPQLIPAEGDLHRLFEAMISSYDQSGKSRVNEQALPIGGGHV